MMKFVVIGLIPAKCPKTFLAKSKTISMIPVTIIRDFIREY